MKTSHRLITAFYMSVLATSVAGCLKKDVELLCQSDEDCEERRSCELISGLCIPSVPDAPAEGLDRSVAVVVGAFDCPLEEDADGSCGAQGSKPMMVVYSPGLATVEVSKGPQWVSACDNPVMEGGGGAEGATNSMRRASIQTGCLFRKRCEMEIGPPETSERPEFYSLRFEQIDASPMNPKNRLEFNFRAVELVVADLAVPEKIQARYYERCSAAGGGLSGESTTELTLQALTVDGDLTITSIDNERVIGSFAIALAHTGTRAFGQPCDLPKDCSQGCAHVEANSAQCISGACFPDLREPESESGLCSGDCDDSGDCGSDLDSANFCLRPPPPSMSTMMGGMMGQAPRGRCIRLCDAAATDSGCPEGTTCESGPPAVQNEFFGEPGPARCLRPPPPPPPRPDGGPGPGPNDGGGPPPDGGPGPDGGGPPPDGGPGPDAGGPPPDGGPGPDAGGPPPDAGAPPDAGGSALGRVCAAGSPCPGASFCATRPGSADLDGFCTIPCSPTSGGTDALCQTDYVGPGLPRCGVPLRRISVTGTVSACGVACGASFAQNGTCPSAPALVCGDIVMNGNGQPGTDGMADYCVDAP